MTNRWFMTIAAAALMFSLTMVVMPRHAQAVDDDIFLDEGDGDFDKMPIPPKPEVKPETKPEAMAETKPMTKPVKTAKAKAKPKAEEKPVEEKMETTPTPDTSTAAAPDVVTPEPAYDEASAPQHVQANDQEFKDEKPVKAPKEKKAEKKHKAVADASSETHSEKHAKMGKGHFVYTTGECPLLRKPASEDSLGQTRTARKIWVEDVDSKWVRGYNKAGEPAYISRDCIK